MVIDMPPPEAATVTVIFAVLDPSATLVAVKVQEPVEDPAKTVQEFPVMLVRVPPPLRLQVTVVFTVPV